MLHKLRVEEGESGKLVLVEVHHEELVRGREVRLLGGELAVKVGDVLAVALQEIQRTRWDRGTEQAARLDHGRKQHRSVKWTITSLGQCLEWLSEKKIRCLVVAEMSKCRE